MFFILHYYLFSLTPSLLYSLLTKHTYKEAYYLNLEAEKAGVKADLQNDLIFLILYQDSASMYRTGEVLKKASGCKKQ